MIIKIRGGVNSPLFVFPTASLTLFVKAVEKSNLFKKFTRAGISARRLALKRLSTSHMTHPESADPLALTNLYYFNFRICNTVCQMKKTNNSLKTKGYHFLSLLIKG